MHPILWALIIALGSSFWVYVSFFALCTAKRIKNSGIRLRPMMKLACYFLLITGWPADLIFNLVQGRYLFGEFRGTTFSSRIEYYYRHPQRCPDQEEFEYWFKLLNTGDPGHIHK